MKNKTVGNSFELLLSEFKAIIAFFLALHLYDCIKDWHEIHPIIG